MSWPLLSAAIKSELEDDNTSGGLFEDGGANEITGVWSEWAMQVADDDSIYPYIVMDLLTTVPHHAFGAEYAKLMQIQFSVWDHRDQGPKRPSDICERIRTVLHGTTLTVSGWTVSPGLVTNGEGIVIETDSNTTQVVATYEFLMSEN